MSKNKVLTEMIRNAGLDPKKVLGEDAVSSKEEPLEEGIKEIEKNADKCLAKVKDLCSDVSKLSTQYYKKAKEQQQTEGGKWGMRSAGDSLARIELLLNQIKVALEAGVADDGGIICNLLPPLDR